MKQLSGQKPAQLTGKTDPVQELRTKLGVSEDDNHDTVSNGFLKRKNLLGNSTEKEIPLELASEELKDLCKLYCVYNSGRIKQIYESQGKGTNEHPDAANIKSQALSIRLGLYGAIGVLAVCEMEIQRAENHLVAGIKKLRMQTPESENHINTSYNLFEELRDAYLKKIEAGKELRIYKKIKILVKMTELILRFIKRETEELLGPERGAAFFSQYKEALIGYRFTRAEELVAEKAIHETRKFFALRKKLKRKKWPVLAEAAKLLARFLSRFYETVSDNNKNLILSISMLEKVKTKTEEKRLKIEAFIALNELPEMKSRKESLDRQKKKLAEIGTAEECLEFTENLEGSCYKPLSTLKAVKDFETNYYTQALRIIEQQKKVEEIRHKISTLAQDPRALAGMA